MRHLALVCTIAATIARAADADEARPVTLRALFPNEAEVTVDGPGVSRLPLSPDVLGACRPDLSDLRLLDSNGNETAFLLDSGVDPNAKIEVVRSAEATIADVTREELRREGAPTTYREAYQLSLPEALPDAGRVQLVVKTARPRFVRRLNVSAVAPDGTLASLVANASLFRLPELPAGGKEHVSFQLPAFSATKLAVALEGEDGPYLEPSFELRVIRALETPAPLVVPLTAVGRQGGEGRTIIQLARPPGLVPDVLKIETTTPWFQRRAAVRDRAHDNDGALLGGTELFRFRDVPGAEALEVPLSRAGGAELSVEITDGDSPPLEQLTFAAIVRQPSLIFFAAEPSNGKPAALLVFGGGRADRPRYDLSGLAPAFGTSARGRDAEVAEYLRDASRVALARLGDVRSNATFDASPALAFAMRAGAPVDRRFYKYRRELAITPSADGVARLRLSAEEASVAREDLADVRVVDDAGSQWPYLVADFPIFEEIGVPVEEAGSRDRVTRYRLRLPASPMPIHALSLETDKAFVDRSFRLVTTREVGTEKREEVATAGRLVRRARDRSPMRISLAGQRVESLELAVDDGSEAPLHFTSVRARIRVPEILIAAPAGRYALLLGKPDDGRPRYELEAVRDVVFTVSSAPVAPGALEKNPDYSVRAELSLRGGSEMVLFWIVLGTAVIVLGTITLRLTRTPPANE